ncbi:unnamed protein product, partial [Mesorhabditis belari]|uniref:Uncharacterized protein n=1 Tax=Mesorhabditis belari TaxID=2138241 RepID=A0AAF3FNU2_9BILA
MMRAILGIAALFGVIYAQQGQPDTCDGIRFQACTVGLGDFWGADPNAIWETPSLFAETINQRFLAPYELSNLVKVCNGLALFYQCLARRNLNACLGPIGWVGRGRSPATAFAFDGMISSLLFQCGPGFNSLAGNPNVTSCLQRVTVNYDAQIQQFYRSYELNVTHDPNSACTYGQSLVNGISGIYSAGPCLPYQGHAQWYSCEMTRNYVFSQFTHCQHVITCPKATSAARDFSHMIRDGADGEKEFLLPAHWDMDSSGNWMMTDARWI